jgi:hypothetical protein
MNMADSTMKTVLSVCATTSGRVKDLPIKHAQIIFIRDTHRIAYDFNGKRTFYNQLEIVESDEERVSIESPGIGQYYFVIKTAVLWQYQDEWIQLTTSPEEILFIGTELPELGSAKTLYVSKSKKQISVWDNESKAYLVVSDTTDDVSEEFIDSLFV